jgi:hypothetical protein
MKAALLNCDEARSKIFPKLGYIVTVSKDILATIYVYFSILFQLVLSSIQDHQSASATVASANRKLEARGSPEPSSQAGLVAIRRALPGELKKDVNGY